MAAEKPQLDLFKRELTTFSGSQEPGKPALAYLDISGVPPEYKGKAAQTGRPARAKSGYPDPLNLLWG